MSAVSSNNDPKLLAHDGYLGRLDQVRESYRTQPGDTLASFDVQKFLDDMKASQGKKPCWELKNCERWPGGKKEAEFGVCITYPWGGWHCWALAGTLCGGLVQGSAAAKEGNCQMCQHYIELMENDPSKLKADSAYFSTVMQTVQVGIATINPKAVVDFQSSRRFQEFFGSGVAGKNLGVVMGLSADQQAKLNEWVLDVFKLYGTLGWDMLYNMFPMKDQDARVGERSYRLTFSPFNKRDTETGEEKLHRLLVQASDVSLEVRALEFAAKERAVADMVVARIKNLSSFRDFLQQAHQLLPRAEGLVKRFLSGEHQPELLDETYRIMHTLKGTSGNFAMDSFVKTAHQSEEFFGKLLKIFERDKASEELKKSVHEYEEVFNSFNVLQKELEEAVKFMADHTGVEIELKSEGSTVNVTTKTLSEAMELLSKGDIEGALSLLSRAKEVSLKPVFMEMAMQVERIARDRGKQVAFLPDGEDVMIDKDIQLNISAALLHIIRNAVDHGIETPDDRMSAGKDGMGVVEMIVKRDNGSLIIIVKDDGKGLDLPKIRKKAGLPDVISDEDVIKQIFKPGFSTMDNATTTSGRGVGMDVVRNVMEEKLSGKVRVKTKLGQGTEITLTLPAMAQVGRTVA
jgi:signal transduction histidine kinase